MTDCSPFAAAPFISPHRHHLSKQKGPPVVVWLLVYTSVLSTQTLLGFKTAPTVTGHFIRNPYLGTIAGGPLGTVIHLFPSQVPL